MEGFEFRGGREEPPVRISDASQQDVIGSPVWSVESPEEQKQTEQEARGLLRELFDDERRVNDTTHDLDVRARVKDQLIRELSQATKELDDFVAAGGVSKRHVLGRAKGVEEQRKELQKEIHVLRKALEFVEMVKPQIHRDEQTPESLSRWLRETHEQSVKDFQSLQERLGSFQNAAWTRELVLLRAHHRQLEEERVAAFRHNEPSAFLVSQLRDQQRITGNIIYIIEEKLKEYHDRLALFGEALRVVGSGRQGADERAWLQASLYDDSVTMTDYLAWMTKRRDILSNQWLSWIPSNREQREELDLRIRYWKDKLRPNQAPYVFPEDRKNLNESGSSPLPMIADEDMESLSDAQEEVVVEEERNRPTIVPVAEDRPTIVPDMVDVVQPKASYASGSFRERATVWVKRWMGPVARVLPLLLLGGGPASQNEEKPRVEPTVDVASEVVVPPEKVLARPRQTMELPHGTTIWSQMSKRLESEGLRATNSRIAFLTHEALASNGLTATQAEKLPDNTIIDLTEVNRLIKQMKDAESRS
jgi:hypothetical protein